MLEHTHTLTERAAVMATERNTAFSSLYIRTGLGCRHTVVFLASPY